MFFLSVFILPLSTLKRKEGEEGEKKERRGRKGEKAMGNIFNYEVARQTTVELPIILEEEFCHPV